MTDKSGDSNIVIPLGQIFLLWNEIDNFVQSVVIQNEKYRTSDWYLEWCAIHPMVGNRHTIPEIGLDVIANSRGTTLARALETLEHNIPHLPSYLTYEIYEEGDLVTISYDIKDFYTFSNPPLSKEDTDKLNKLLKSNKKTVEDQSKDDKDVLDLDDEDLVQSKENEKAQSAADEKEIMQTPRSFQATLTQMYPSTPKDVNIPPMQDATSKLSGDSPVVAPVTTDEDTMNALKLLDKISVRI